MANRKSVKATPIGEWITAAVGLILVVTATSLMIYRAATKDSMPPQLEVAVDSVEPSGDGYLVEFIVKNTGNQTAAAVVIEGKLENEAETGTATLTYVPSNSTRRGGLFFTKDPRRTNLKLRAAGYEIP